MRARLLVAGEVVLPFLESSKAIILTVIFCLAMAISIACHWLYDDWILLLAVHKSLGLHFAQSGAVTYRLSAQQRT